MTASPIISVIIVNFNSGELLTRCVRAVLASTIPILIHVVDNASNDISLQQLEHSLNGDPRVKIIRNDKNLGFACAANRALSETAGDYVLFLNPDCFIHADTLACFHTLMEQYPHVGMAGCLVRNPDGSEQAGCRRSIPSPWRALVRVFHLDKFFPNHPRFKSFVLTHQPLPKEPIEIEGISGACMFVRRTALNVVGPMDEAYFLHCEDLDWFMRFHAKQWSILFIPTIEVTHLKGACSKNQPLRVLWYKHRGMIRFYRKFFRHRYPLIIMGMVILAVWTRFTLLALVTLVHRYFFLNKQSPV